MTQGQKKAGVIALVVAAVGAAAYSIYYSISLSEPKEEIVGTIDFGPKGGRETEKASVGQPPAGDVASGMPPEMANPGAGGGNASERGVAR